MPDGSIRQRMFLANKYIGVYKGKFGILTKKLKVSTKQEDDMRNQVFKEKMYRMHKNHVDPTIQSPNKDIKTHRIPHKNPEIESENSNNKLYRTHSFDSGHPAPKIQNLRLPTNRKSVDNLQRYLYCFLNIQI